MNTRLAAAIRLICTLVVISAAGARPATAQLNVGFDPWTSSYVENHTINYVTISFCSVDDPYYFEHWITLNGQDVSGNFSLTGGSQSGCAYYATAVGPVTVGLGQNTLLAGMRTWDGADHFTEGDNSVVYTGIAAAAAPIVSILPHNGHNRNLGSFNTQVSYSTPAYWSMDVPRSVTLSYNSGSVGGLHSVQVYATNTAWNVPQKMSLRLRKPDNSYVTFTNGSSEIYFYGESDEQILAVQFQDTTLATGAHNYTAVVRAYFSGSSHATEAAVRVLVINDRSSPYGAGWAVAGIPTLQLGPGDSLSMTDGLGGISFWRRSSCSGSGTVTCYFTAPSGRFDSLTSCSGSCASSYRLRLIDGSHFEFDYTGKPIDFYDPFDTRTGFYWTSNRIDSIVDPVGKKITFGYDGSNRLSSLTDSPGNRTTQISINGNNDLTRITDPAGDSTFGGANYTGHRLTLSVDRRGEEWRRGYDFAGALAADSTPAVTVNDTSGLRLVTRYRSPLSAVLVDPGSGLGSSGSPAPSDNDSVGVARVVPSGGDTIKTRLDVYGLPLEVLGPAHAFSRYTRNVHGQPATVEDSTGSWSFSWIGPRVNVETDLVTGRSATSTWNTTYNRPITRYGSAVTRRVTNFYGTGGRLDSSKVAGEPASQFTYSAAGRLLTAADPWGHTTTYNIASSGLKNTDSVTSGVRRTRYVRDAIGRVVLASGPGGFRDSTVYDVLNRVQRRIGPMGAVTQFAYGDSLNLTQVTDPLGQTYSSAVNAVGWSTVITDPLSRNDSLWYNRQGQVTRSKNRRGQLTVSAYDGLGRLTSSDPDVGSTTTFSHSPRKLVAANGEGTDTLRFAGDTSYAISVRGGYTYTVRSYHDTLIRARRVSVWRNGHSPLETVYRSDTLGRLRAILPPAPSSATDSLIYGSDGRLATVKLHGASTATLAYRPHHDLGQLSYSMTGGQTFFNQAYVHDSLGRLIERRRANRADIERFAYDSLSRLQLFTRYTASPVCGQTDTSVDVESQCASTLTLVRADTFSYDLLGNRNRTGDSVGTGNRQGRQQGYRFTYDDDGNLTRKWWEADSTAFDQRYFWNTASQLDSVKYWNTSAWFTVRFGYDAFGRRVRRESSASGTTYYVWDSDQVIAEYGSSGSLTRQFTYYGTDRPHSVYETGPGSRNYFIGDGLANVTGLISDGGGTTMNYYRYLPFGVVDSSSGSNPNKLQFSGREWDSETRLFFNRARYYDPDVGRFISQDPLGLDGGINPYVFANNDPVNGWDPSGSRCRWRQETQEASARESGGSSGDGWVLECYDFIGPSFQNPAGGVPWGSALGGYYALPTIGQDQCDMKCQVRRASRASKPTGLLFFLGVGACAVKGNGTCAEAGLAFTRRGVHLFGSAGAYGGNEGSLFMTGGFMSREVSFAGATAEGCVSGAVLGGCVMGNSAGFGAGVSVGVSTPGAGRVGGSYTFLSEPVAWCIVLGPFLGWRGCGG